MSGPFLQLNGVGVHYGERRILHDIQLGFSAGTLTALVGPNGAGKSTLLAVAAGDVGADAGAVILHDRPIGDWKAMALARERAVMPQDHAVRFAFTVEEVVAMGRLPHAADAVRDAALIESALDKAEMQGLREREVRTLSGGEAARATFARVLTQRRQERTLRAVRELANAGACVIVVVHDLNLAAGYADRIVLLEQGRVAADGTPDAVLTREHIERVYQQPVLVLRHPQRNVPLVVVADP